MSNYGPTIETLDDWNALIACCCDMPSCPIPTMLCESATVSVGADHGAQDPSSWPDNTTGGLWATWTRPAGADEDAMPKLYRTSTFDGEGTFEPTTFSCTETVITRSEGSTVVNTVTLGDPVTYSYILGVAETDLASAGWLGVQCVSLHSKIWPLIWEFDWGVSCEDLYYDDDFRNATGGVTLRKTRFRFRIPNSHTGNIYQFTYDVLTTPTGWSPDPGYTGPVRSYLEDQTLEWTGPGTGPADDPSWFTDWVTLEPPGSPGIREVVNIRFICYPNSPYGVKPQVTGTAADLTNDSPLVRQLDRPKGSIHLPL